MLQFYDTNRPEQMTYTFRLLFFSLFMLPVMSSADETKVLASVHPLALIAASVADNLDTLVPQSTTPHDFAFRPSDIRKVKDADIIFWSGAESEPYLARFEKRWPDKVWIDISAPVHQPGTSDDHNHDAHWWLAPELAITAQQALAQALNKESQFEQQLRAQLKLSRQQLLPVKQLGFFVFHRAYDHWVNYFGLNQLGSFTLSPEQKPGLKRLNAMREQLASGDVRCIFTEPQFEPKLVSSVTRGLDIPAGELDPLGIHISVTKHGYAEFVRDLTQRFVSCLAAGK
ncbi:MAG: zinc ABC transporter substrate-binding protein [Saccharospirillaceae bacterium]|jgi:zinc transport system substrate-binding protein|nr:zinc ABC transporter substrate-binding protein [Saccharospirillaceae bacterium]